MRLILPFLILSTLAACGVDGAPQRPEAKPGVTVTGEASLGMVTQ